MDGMIFFGVLASFVLFLATMATFVNVTIAKEMIEAAEQRILARLDECCDSHSQPQAAKAGPDISRIWSETGQRQRLSENDKIILDAIGRLSRGEQDILVRNLKQRERTAVWR